MATNGKKGVNVKNGKATSKKHTQTGQKISDEKSMTRGTSKQAMLIKLLERPGGTTIDEMVKTTGWQQHSIRGVISGVLKKRLGLSIASEKSESGRIYSTVAL